MKNIRQSSLTSNDISEIEGYLNDIRQQYDVDVALAEIVTVILNANGLGQENNQLYVLWDRPIGFQGFLNAQLDRPPSDQPLSKQFSSFQIEPREKALLVASQKLVEKFEKFFEEWENDYVGTGTLPLSYDKFQQSLQLFRDVIAPKALKKRKEAVPSRAAQKTSLINDEGFKKLDFETFCAWRAGVELHQLAYARTSMPYLAHKLHIAAFAMEAGMLAKDVVEIFEADTHVPQEIKKSLKLARKIHYDQTRRSNGMEYFIHLLEASAFVAQATSDLPTLAATFLHDAYEDQMEKYGGEAELDRYLEQQFGKSFAQVAISAVKEVSVFKKKVIGQKKDWLTSKNNYIQTKIPNMSSQALLICASDKLANLRWFVREFEESAGQKKDLRSRLKHIWYFSEVLQGLKKRVEELSKPLPHSISFEVDSQFPAEMVESVVNLCLNPQHPLFKETQILHRGKKYHPVFPFLEEHFLPEINKRIGVLDSLAEGAELHQKACRG